MTPPTVITARVDRVIVCRTVRRPSRLFLWSIPPARHLMCGTLRTFIARLLAPLCPEEKKGCDRLARHARIEAPPGSTHGASSLGGTPQAHPASMHAWTASGGGAERPSAGRADEQRNCGPACEVFSLQQGIQGTVPGPAVVPARAPVSLSLPGSLHRQHDRLRTCNGMRRARENRPPVRKRGKRQAAGQVCSTLPPYTPVAL